jgi:hypothetical protein
MDRALALLVFLCLAALPRIAGAGAWPREPGSGFVAVSYTGWGEVLGYIEGISTKTDPAAGDLTYELSIYAEYGLARRLTFGLDRFDRLGGASTETYLFLRRHLGARNARDQYAIEIAFGIEQTDLVPGSRQATRLGFFYGRGLDTRWGSGWLAIEGLCHRRRGCGLFGALSPHQTGLVGRDAGRAVRADQRLHLARGRRVSHAQR